MVSGFGVRRSAFADRLFCEEYFNYFLAVITCQTFASLAAI